jgi:hypothetical protein
MLKEISSVGSRLIIAVAAFVALSLAVGITTRVIDRFGPLTIWDVMGRSLIIAAFVLMAFVMISYLIKKFRAGKQS